ncbi:Hypothetical predicted protein, partial [Pelobates cultripes]
VTTTSIDVITWSDHADKSLTLRILNLTWPWTWKLNPLLLHNTALTKTISTDITDYFELKTDPEAISPITLWTAHKAVIRGKLISLATQSNNIILSYPLSDKTDSFL